MLVTVAIPVRNGGRLLAELLGALSAQQLASGVEVELVVADSASTDGSAELARAQGARVIPIAAGEFSHGGTRNRLMAESRGRFVAFLSQDAVPADRDWLARLLGGFELADDVALTFGPYRPRADASLSVACELERFFDSLRGPDGPRVDRLAPEHRDVAARTLYGPLAYFTDANGCVARRAWERVPFRQLPYAEDHALAIDMLRAGLAKAYVPDATVVHSHEYPLRGWFRRSFDEARAVRDLYGLDDLGSPRRLALGVRGAVGADRRAGAAGGELARSLAHHCARAAGTALGARAELLPAGVNRRLSLERRG